MRIFAEHIPDSNRILVRLLEGDPDLPPSPILIGTYIIDATPQIREALFFEVEPEQVVNGEAKIFFAGYLPLPPSLTITLPDSTVVRVELGKILIPQTKILAEQKKETITPVEKEEHRPAESKTPKIEKMAPPELPVFWFEFTAANTQPVKAGSGTSSPMTTYEGGCEGRMLSNTIVQPEENAPPFKIGGNLYLEGELTNTLVNSDFSAVHSVDHLFDPVPNGWLITGESLRLSINKLKNTTLPNLQFIYYPQGIELITPNAAIITTPPLDTNETLQFIAESGARNATGSLRLLSAGGIESQTYPLIEGKPQIILFNVGSDNGPVRIYWIQNGGDYGQQKLNIIAPQSSLYNGIHSWVPYSKTSKKDRVAFTLHRDKWVFDSVKIRMDSSLEKKEEPVNWKIISESGESVLQVINGVLSSDFSTMTLTLSDYTLNDLSLAGNYKLRGFKSNPFQITTKLPEVPEVSTVLPFSFDLPFTNTLLASTYLEIEFEGFSTNQGSCRLNYFSFAP